MSGPGRKLMRILVPNALLIAAWKRAAPWLPPKVDWLQLSVTTPSRFAAAGSSLRAGFIACAAAAAQPPSRIATVKATLSSRRRQPGIGVTNVISRGEDIDFIYE